MVNWSKACPRLCHLIHLTKALVFEAFSSRNWNEPTSQPSYPLESTILIPVIADESLEPFPRTLYHYPFGGRAPMKAPGVDR